MSRMRSEVKTASAVRRWTVSRLMYHSTFTGSDLRLLPDALAHAKRGRAIMVGNIGLSLALIVVLMPLALFGVLGLATVVLVHEIAEVIVILNGIRAARRKRTALTVAAPTRTPVTV